MTFFSNLFHLHYRYQGAVCILCGQKNGPKKSSGQRDRTPNAPASRAVADLAQLPYDHLKGLGFCHKRCQQPAYMSQRNYAELPYAPHGVALRMQIRSQVCGCTSHCIFHVQHQRCVLEPYKNIYFVQLPPTHGAHSRPPQKCYNKCLKINLFFLPR